MFCDGKCEGCGLYVEVVKSDDKRVRYKDRGCLMYEQFQATLQIRDHLFALRQEGNKQRNEVAKGFQLLAHTAQKKRLQ